MPPRIDKLKAAHWAHRAYEAYSNPAHLPKKHEKKAAKSGLYL